MGFGHVPIPAKLARFVGTHEHVTGAEDPSRIENKTCIYTQTFQVLTSQP